jgi:hypothetical protein
MRTDCICATCIQESTTTITYAINGTTCPFDITLLISIFYKLISTKTADSNLKGTLGLLKL